MSYIYDLDPKFYSTLLATQKLDIVDRDSNDNIGVGKIPPADQNRTILIGVGGTGVQTINHVKRVISSKLAPNWKNYIAFLAIDSDNNEFDNATHLTEEEFVRTTKSGIQLAVSKGRVGYPKAWIPFVDEDAARAMNGFDGNGSGRKRLMGKMKVHYKLSGSKGVDEEIVAKLMDRKNNVLDPFPSQAEGHYDVYVIGSVSGGTCSGSFLEMPALIHRALNSSSNTQVHAMLYLPDTLTGLDSAHADELMANGYASLKELDYYEGLKMREDTEETFYYNEPSCSELKIHASNDFFTLPYLIGTRNGATVNSKQEACETIAEFFISILGRMVPPDQNAFLVDSFLNNAINHVNERLTAEGNDNLELDGVDHSRPKRYATVGFAQAAAPEQIVKAYTISHACKLAGLEPISADERAARIAAGDQLLPFYGEDQFYNAMEVNAANRTLLESLQNYMMAYQAQKFSYSTTFGSNPTWEEIHDGGADDMGRTNRVNKLIEDVTGTAAAKRLQEEVTAQFAAFRSSVRAYVKNYGPMAFVNLYEGHAEKNEGGPSAVGIRETLNALRDDLDIATNSPRVWPSAAEAKQSVENAKREIIEDAGGLIGFITNAIRGNKEEHASKWVMAFNGWVNIRINAELRKHMLGANGILSRHFIEPANILCQQLYTFGKLMNAMAEGYKTYGKALNNYEDFAKINGGSAQVNIAALHQGAHAYLKHKAEQAARTVEAVKVRNALVDSFFDDTAKWMEYDENTIVRRGGGSQVTLLNPNCPIGARYEFDRCLRQSMPSTVEIRIDELFLNSGVDNRELAEQIVTKLDIKSAPLFNGKLPSADTKRYMMYPQSLSPALKTALEDAARNKISNDFEFYGTDYADAIMMYQLVAPFEMYKLAELKDWENQYLTLKNNDGNGLHGRSPDLVKKMDERGTTVYDEKTTWFDYPAITYSRDPKERDSVTGEISHEGLVRIEMDKVIAEARKKGILYSHKTNLGWTIKRVHLDGRVEWNFDETLLDGGADGRLPEGKELLSAIVEQNNGNLTGFSKTVRLAYAGLMSKAHAEEKWAWEYASRVLYVHRPMFIEVRDTLELTRPWYEAVEAITDIYKRDMYPAKMYKLIQAGILRLNENGMWVFQGERNKKNIANISANGLKILRSARPKEAALVDTGLTLYYLYTKLMQSIKPEDLDEAMVRANENMCDDEYAFSDEFVTINDGLISTLEKELAVVTNMGADLEDYTNIKDKFRKNMAAKRIMGDEQLEEILKFYSKIALWDTL